MVVLPLLLLEIKARWMKMEFLPWLSFGGLKRWG